MGTLLKRGYMGYRLNKTELEALAWYCKKYETDMINLNTLPVVVIMRKCKRLSICSVDIIVELYNYAKEVV